MELSFNFKKLNQSFTIGSSAQIDSSPKTLSSAIAGSWYPRTAVELDAFLGKISAKIPNTPDESPPNVLLLPHAGYPYSAECAMHGIKLINNANFTRVVLLAPNHRRHVSNKLIAPESDFAETPYGTIPIDHEGINQLAKLIPIELNDSSHYEEHSTQIEYPLLQYALGDKFKLIPLIVGEVTDDFADCAAKALRQLMDKQTLLVISSDFTHYGRDFGFSPFGSNAREKVAALDHEAWQYIQELDGDKFNTFIQQSHATICGRNPIFIMLKMLPHGTKMVELNYQTSSDSSGDFSRFVAYLCGAAYAEWNSDSSLKEDFLSPKDKITLLQIARQAIKYGLEQNTPCRADRFDAEASQPMKKIAGCFVTLSMSTSGALRGCIGEIKGSRPLYQAVASRAFDSAFRDPRFMKLTADELDQIEVEISVLTPSHPVDSYSDIVIGKHGMTIEKNGRGAVFLPQVAPEQGWNLEQTLTNLCLKAGLEANDWRAGARFAVFEAIVFNEKEFPVA